MDLSPGSWTLPRMRRAGRIYAVAALAALNLSAMDVVTAICDRITVLSYGEVIAQGEPRTAIAHPRVVEAYLGTGHA